MTEPALTQIDSTTGLNPPDRQSKRTTMLTVDKKRKMRKPRFAFLKISASAHLAHMQSRTSHHKKNKMEFP